MWKLDICVNHLTKCQLLGKVIPVLGIKSALKKVNTNIKRNFSAKDMSTEDE